MSNYNDPSAAVITCTPKQLPREELLNAARNAVRENPTNHAPVERLLRITPQFAPSPEHLAVLTTKYWGTRGRTLSVSFMDMSDSALRRRILEHMNAWNERANVRFRETSETGEVRIARLSGANGGYWSYLGTDILSIPKDQPTLNLEAFTMRTSEAEFRRVVRHEAGHTLGFPHEHMRKELVDLIDVRKAIEYFRETQGWSEQEVRQQVLTPIEESSLLGTLHPDPNSIMCYQIPGRITKNGEPIPGGANIDAEDFDFAESIYPKPRATSDEPEPEPSEEDTARQGDAVVIEYDGFGGIVRVRVNPANRLALAGGGDRGQRRGGGGRENGPSRAEVKRAVDTELCAASPRHPTPPLDDDANLSGDLNIGPNTKRQLANNYNSIIHRHGGRVFVSPSEAGAVETVGEAVDLVFGRV